MHIASLWSSDTTSIATDHMSGSHCNAQAELEYEEDSYTEALNMNFIIVKTCNMETSKMEEPSLQVAISVKL